MTSTGVMAAFRYRQKTCFEIPIPNNVQLDLDLRLLIKCHIFASSPGNILTNFK